MFSGAIRGINPSPLTKPRPVGLGRCLLVINLCYVTIDSCRAESAIPERVVSTRSSNSTHQFRRPRTAGKSSEIDSGGSIRRRLPPIGSPEHSVSPATPEAETSQRHGHKSPCASSFIKFGWLVNQEKKTELTFHPTLNKRKPLCSGLHLLIDDLFRWGPSRFFWLSTRKLRRIASVAGTDSHFSRRRTPLFELPRVRAPDSGTPDVMPPTPPVYQSRSCRGCGQRSRLKLRRCRFRSPPPRQCRHRCGCRVGPVHRTYPNRVLGRPA
jgi:hypothetical protein